MQDLQLFKKYKMQFLALCFILGGLLIILIVIIPNINQIVLQQGKNVSEEEKLSEINRSTQLIQSTQEEILKDNLSVAVNALPSEKDVTAIYTSLTSAAAASGVFFEGFTVSPGGIYGEDGEVVQGIPSVAVTAKISNVDNETLVIFLERLSHTSPLSEVKEIKLSSGTADIELLFFYKPYDLSAINGDIVTSLTTVEEEILKMLKESN